MSIPLFSLLRIYSREVIDVFSDLTKNFNVSFLTDTVLQMFSRGLAILYQV